MKYYALGRLNVANFITGMGCPYRCSYCNAEQLFSNGYLRFRSPESVIGEIDEVRKRFDIRKVIFSDETFTLKKKQLFALLGLYRSKINLPFVCQTRAECVDEEVVKELSKSNCESVTMGIESGNEDIRKNHLNRWMSNQQIINAFRLFTKYNVEANSFNMVGLPDETQNTIYEGIELNSRAGVSNPCCTVFMPFKGTKIYDWYKENGLIEREPDIDYYNSVTINHPNISKRKLLLYARYYSKFVASCPTSLKLKNLLIFNLNLFVFNFRRKSNELVNYISWFFLTPSALMSLAAHFLKREFCIILVYKN